MLIELSVRWDFFHSLALPMKIRVYVLYMSTVASQTFMGYNESGFSRFIDLLKLPV